eukprot:COSAG02_NODE_4406_length_5396_cov_1.985463_4_plen_132_part_00
MYHSVYTCVHTAVYKLQLRNSYRRLSPPPSPAAGELRLKNRQCWQDGGPPLVAGGHPHGAPPPRRGLDTSPDDAALPALFAACSAGEHGLSALADDAVAAAGPSSRQRAVNCDDEGVPAESDVGATGGAAE